MAAITTNLRNYKEPSKEDQTRLFFALPSEAKAGEVGSGMGAEKMEINAVLTLQNQEESYVSACALTVRLNPLIASTIRPGSCICSLHSFASFLLTVNRRGLPFTLQQSAVWNGLTLALVYLL